MSRSRPPVLHLLAAGCWFAGLSVGAQSMPDPLQEINKCVRGHEVFYTNGECPKGARPLKLSDPMAEPSRSAPSPPRSGHSNRNARDNGVVPHDSAPSESTGFRPLNSFPRLPESQGTPSGAGWDHAPSEAREAPVRASNRPIESTPVPDAAASNQVMCGFVAAELSRLATELAAADEAGQARIATHQKRLNERAAQLQCG